MTHFLLIWVSSKLHWHHPEVEAHLRQTLLGEPAHGCKDPAAQHVDVTANQRSAPESAQGARTRLPRGRILNGPSLPFGWLGAGSCPEVDDVELPIGQTLLVMGLLTLMILAVMWLLAATRSSQR